LRGCTSEFISEIKIRALNLSVERLRKFHWSNVGVILVEGIPQEEYSLVVREIQDHFSELEKSLSRDFLEMLLEEYDLVSESLRRHKNQFVYNLDLFGEDVDPNEATDIMGLMRSDKNMYSQIRQLMVARPNANLDYNSRRGFTYHNNHPLGNWCEFYRLVEGELVRESGPIKHQRYDK